MVQKVTLQPGQVPSQDNAAISLITQTDQDLCEITLIQTYAMLRKVRQVIPSFPLFPRTSEDRKHSGQNNSNQTV